MLEPRYTMWRLVLIFSTAGAVVLALLLLFLLGTIIFRTASLDVVRHPHLLILATISLLALFAFAGTAAVLSHPETAELLPGNSLRPKAVRFLCDAAAAFAVASLSAALLEIAGLWKRLVRSPDPLMDQGAPVWIWWILLTLSFLLYFHPRRRRPCTNSYKSLTIKISVATMAGLVLASGATLLHEVRFDPVPSKYYGIPGFIVGRQFSNEYGTYYGAVGGMTAAVLGLCALIMIFFKVSGYPYHTTGESTAGGRK